jgi:hypothetical protein
VKLQLSRLVAKTHWRDLRRADGRAV